MKGSNVCFNTWYGLCIFLINSFYLHFTPSPNFFGIGLDIPKNYFDESQPIFWYKEPQKVENVFIKK